MDLLNSQNLLAASATVVAVAIARELAALLWAEMTDQPAREEILAA